MIDLDFVRPGRTIRIPFSTFDKDDGSSITMTNYAVADILIYKDGSTTERASTSGFTATTDFDSKTGKHVIVVDLADNTTADFFQSGSEYLVAIDAVTVDGVTTGGWVARFRIGYTAAIVNTTIASLSTQTSFTLTEGPAEDDALNGLWVIIHDAASAVQWGWGVVSDYTGSTKTVTLVAGTTFTAAAKDNISVMGPAPLQPTVIGRTLDVTATGAAGIDWGNVENKTTSNDLSSTLISTSQIVASVSGNVGGSVGSIAANGLSATSIATGAITNAKFAAGAIDAAATSADFVTEIRNAITGGAYALDTDANGRLRIVDGTGTGELDTSSGLVGVASIAANAVSASALATDAVNEIVDQVWRETLADHSGTSGSTAEALSAAGGAGDPWITALPGAYGAGSAGFLVGTYLNATVSSRSSHSASDVWAVGTRTLSALGFTLGASDLAADTITAAKVAADVSTDLRTAINGGDWALSTDANGRIRIVDGTGTGELDSTSGGVLVASVAANALNASALAADAVAEIQSGLSTHSASDVWAVGARTLTALDEDSTTIDLDGTIRASIGLASANLDTQFSGIPAAVWDLADGIETSITPRKAMRAIAAKAAGLISGAGTGTEVVKGIGQSSGGTTRLTATVDASGNISAWTLNL